MDLSDGEETNLNDLRNLKKPIGQPGLIQGVSRSEKPPLETKSSNQKSEEKKILIEKPKETVVVEETKTRLDRKKEIQHRIENTPPKDKTKKEL